MPPMAADWRQVPVQIREVDDRQMAELAIVENVQRKDLNAIEKAESFQRYIDQYQCTQEELAGRVQIDRSTVANLIRLLELPADVKQMVQQGDISQGHARALLPLGDEQEQIEFAKKIKKEGMSVRATEQGVHDRIHALDGDQLADRRRRRQLAPVPRPRNEQIASLEQELRTALGTKVDLSQSAKGKGKITIHFNSHEEFERVRQTADGDPRPSPRASAATDACLGRQTAKTREKPPKTGGFFHFYTAASSSRSVILRELNDRRISTTST